MTTIYHSKYTYSFTGDQFYGEFEHKNDVFDSQ